MTLFLLWILWNRRDRMVLDQVILSHITIYSNVKEHLDLWNSRVTPDDRVHLVLE